ncbi:MAG: toll/interleukin-1 receptor domain-containing protein [Dehalococcoidia bacterium]|nr:toll/interleukin-1 receptor domain-containing protein [Dehalococcoidia bacterium]MSQ16624.1 toll/interleukin-1 receptor domain-containing protein [Dehalococcoidia bacterium]
MSRSTGQHVRVFVSHNSLDKEVARELGLYLVAEDLGAWFDEWEISAGDSIVQQIQNGLIGCTHLVIVWSANANRSQWVRRELESAIHLAIESGKPKSIPVLLDQTAMPPLIRDIRYISYKGGTEADRSQLIEAVIGSPPSQNLI